jgi:hypothetical protein
MSDKPLDCVGLDLGSARIGKYDFQRYATTNAAAPARVRKRRWGGNGGGARRRCAAAG